MTFRNSRC